MLCGSTSGPTRKQVDAEVAGIASVPEADRHHVAKQAVRRLYPGVTDETLIDLTAKVFVYRAEDMVIMAERVQVK